MPSFAGIDLGSHWIKAATSSASAGSERVLQLDPTRHVYGLPFVIRGDDDLGARWEQYAARCIDFNVAFAFRDRVRASAERLVLAGESLPADRALKPICAGVRHAVAAQVNDLGGVGVSVPDAWSTDASWALPNALKGDGWSTTVFVRESVAALAAWPAHRDAGRIRSVLTISLGAGSMSASLLRRTDSGTWKLADTANDTACSGSALRALVIKAFASEVISRLRKDPTESAPDDQRLNDAVEAALQTLETNRESDLRAELFGSPIEIPFSRARLAELARPLHDRLLTTLNEWSRRFARHEPVDCVIYWGDLASKLAIGPQIARIFSRSETVGLDAYCVARGVARIVKRIHAEQLGMTGAEKQGKIPIFESLPPLERSTGHAAGPGATVVQLDGASDKMIEFEDALRFGRSSAADCVIADHHPEVSNAHAAILRRGSIYVLKDLESTNGTYINGRRLTGPTPLKHGDVITLAIDGPRFRFEDS